ncbi:MAG: hypothetical protein GC182_13450 [Rhodopseudomonas sp.]|nr:hypothetical protein [Rhodopseudomonas sp.]
MKIAIIGAVVGAALLSALPASAEVVVHAGGNGVVVREHVDHGHHYGWRHHRASCRTVTVRTHRANGTVVVRKRTVC